MKAGDVMLLRDQLKQLKLPTMQQNWEVEERQAQERGDGYGDYLLTLSSKELERRRNNQLQRRLKEAGFPQLKPMEETDISKWPGIETRKIRELMGCEYLKRRENLILIGKHGTGKTHAALALGIEACRQGYRVRFHTAAGLANQLIEARDAKGLRSALKKLKSYDLLVLDELGYLPFGKEGGELLFQVVSERYEQGSLLVTTNLNFSEWTQVFGDVNLTAALVDRITHRSYIQVFDWESIRFTESLKRQSQGR